MNKSLKTAVFVIAGLLQACATSYVQPTGFEVAELKIGSDIAVPVEVKVFKNASDCSGGKMLVTSSGTLPAFGELTLRVKPNEAFSFFVSYAESSFGGITYCNFPATFVPRERGRYSARFLKSDGKCYMPVMVQTETGEELEPTFKHRQWRAPFIESGSFCN